MTTLSYKGLEVGRLYNRTWRGTWYPKGIALLVAINLNVHYNVETYNDLVFLAGEQVKTYSYMPHEKVEKYWELAF